MMCLIETESSMYENLPTIYFKTIQLRNGSAMVPLFQLILIFFDLKNGGRYSLK